MKQDINHLEVVMQSVKPYEPVGLDALLGDPTTVDLIHMNKILHDLLRQKKQIAQLIRQIDALSPIVLTEENPDSELFSL